MKLLWSISYESCLHWCFRYFLAPPESKSECLSGTAFFVILNTFQLRKIQMIYVETNCLHLPFLPRKNLSLKGKFYGIFVSGTFVFCQLSFAVCVMVKPHNEIKGRKFACDRLFGVDYSNVIALIYSVDTKCLFSHLMCFEVEPD